MKRNPKEHVVAGIMTGELKKLIVTVAGTTSVFLIALYLILLQLELPIEEVRTIMFVALSLDAIFFSFSLKSLDTPLWRINLFNNIYLLVALGISIALLIAAVSWGPLQTLLTLTPLAAWEMLLLAGVGICNLLVIEIVKYFIYERKRTERVIAA